MLENIKINPEFERLIPPLVDDEFELLERNIVLEGEIYTPLFTWNGYIIDGHHRYKILCKHENIKFKVIEKEFENMTELPETEDAIFVKFGEMINVPNGKVILDYHLPELKIGDVPEERTLAKDIHLHIRGPEKICIIGKNGCGKTTLLRKIAMELATRKDIKVSYMPQNYEECLDAQLTPVEFSKPLWFSPLVDARHSF